MSEVTNIRTALNSVLAAGFSGWQTSPYLLPNPEPPTLDIMTGPISYDTAMASGNYDLEFIVRALVQWGDSTSAQAALDPLIDQGNSSVKAVLEADKTLGGTVSSLRVTDVSEVKVYPTSGGSDAPGVEFRVAVTPNG